MVGSRKLLFFQGLELLEAGELGMARPPCAYSGMTMQRTDGVELHGATYFLIGGNGGPLATPEYFAMKSEMLSTACYRGYYALYAFVSDTLVLRDFTLRAVGGIYHALNGVKAQGLPAQGTYRGLELIIPFTGTLRLANGIIPGLDDLRPSPLAFREVRDGLIARFKHYLQKA